MRPRGSPKTPGSGRSKGTPNKSSLPIAQLCADKGLSPLDVMIGFLAHDDEAYRFQAAKELMQYLYPKRKAIERGLDDYDLEEILSFIETKFKEMKNVTSKTD